MADSLNVFVRGGGGIEEIADALETFVGHGLTKNSDVDWALLQTFSMGIDMSLYEQKDFEDAGDLDFSRFDYVIDLQPVANVALVDDKDEWVTAVAKMMTGTLIEDFGCQCLVTKNFQKLIGRYGPTPFEASPRGLGALR